MARAALKEKKERTKAQTQAKKDTAREFRARRSIAFKHNVERVGLLGAKFIANLISAKQKGTFLYGIKDGIRGKVFASGNSTAVE